MDRALFYDDPHFNDILPSCEVGLNGMKSKQNVIVMGLGYVGCVSAACFAEIGHSVLGVDRDSNKVEAVRKAQSPFSKSVWTALSKEMLPKGGSRPGHSMKRPLMRQMS